MTKFYTFFDRWVENWCKVLLVAQVLVVSYVVFGRFILRTTPGWGEESALVAMVWFGLLSASIGVREDAHISVTIIEKVLPPSWIKWSDRINKVLIFIFGVFMLVEGIKLTQLTTLNILPGLNIPSSWLYASIPAAGLALMVQLIHGIKKDVS